MGKKIVETCELNVYLVDEINLLRRLNPFHKRLWQWQAQAIGPKGTYVAAWSGTFKAQVNYAGYGARPQSAMGDASQASESARKEVISIMLRDGWIPMNDRYYGQTYTRETEAE